MARPVTLTAVVVLQWVAAVIAAISGFDLVSAALEMSDAGMGEQLENVLAREGIVDIAGGTLITAVFVAGVLLLAVAVMRVMAAMYLARGRSWARILVSVFAGINLVGGLAFLVEGYWIRAVTTVILELIVLALLFSTSSSAFIRERSAAVPA
jgi:hypothetical protein